MRGVRSEFAQQVEEVWEQASEEDRVQIDQVRSSSSPACARLARWH
jgi:hypothetical protein